MSVNNQPNMWIQASQQPNQQLPPQPPGFAPNFGVFPPQGPNWNQPVAPMQPPQQPNSSNQMAGSNWRFVNSPDEVLPVEVPMNGAIGIFVNNNLSEIYLKRWNKQGGIDTITYHIEQPEPTITITEQRETFPEFTQIMTRMDEMMDLLSSINQTSGNSNKRTSTKKEVTSNE